MVDSFHASVRTQPYFDGEQGYFETLFMPLSRSKFIFFIVLETNSYLLFENATTNFASSFEVV